MLPIEFCSELFAIMQRRTGNIFRCAKSERSTVFNRYAVGSSALIGEEVNLNVCLPFQTSFRKTAFFHFAITCVICVDLSHLNTPYSPKVCNIKCGKGQRMWMLGIYTRVCVFFNLAIMPMIWLCSLHAAVFGLLAALTRKSPLWIIIRKPLCPFRASWCPSAGVFLFKEEYLRVRVCLAYFESFVFFLSHLP